MISSFSLNTDTEPKRWALSDLRVFPSTHVLKSSWEQSCGKTDHIRNQQRYLVSLILYFKEYLASTNNTVINWHCFRTNSHYLGSPCVRLPSINYCYKSKFLTTYVAGNIENSRRGDISISSWNLRLSWYGIFSHSWLMFWIVPQIWYLNRIYFYFYSYFSIIIMMKMIQFTHAMRAWSVLLVSRPNS